MQYIVNVSLNQTNELFVGIGLTLICNMTLDANIINNNESVKLEWTGLPIA